MKKYNIEKITGNTCSGQELIKDMSKGFQNVCNKYRSKTFQNWSAAEEDRMGKI